MVHCHNKVAALTTVQSLQLANDALHSSLELPSNLATINTAQEVNISQLQLMKLTNTLQNSANDGNMDPRIGEILWIMKQSIDQGFAHQAKVNQWAEGINQILEKSSHDLA